MKGYVRSLGYAAAAALLFGAAGASAQRGDGRPGPDWDRDIEVRCESSGQRHNLCQVDIGAAGKVALVRQTSGTRCVEGRNWGSNRAGVWVNAGCSGVFRVERRWGGDRHDDNDGRRDDRRGDRDDWRPGADFDRSISVRCASQGYKYQLCQVDTGRGSDVRLTRQISKSACVEGRSWGFNRAGIWVNEGCEAIFTIERRWR
jgi:Protein of unknown function (DUF3011)